MRKASLPIKAGEIHRIKDILSGSLPPSASNKKSPLVRRGSREGKCEKKKWPIFQPQNNGCLSVVFIISHICYRSMNFV